MASGGTGSYGAVSVGTSATQILVGRSTRDGLIVQNVHASQNLYVGSNSSVATASGVKVAAGQSIDLGSYSGPVYGIADGASTDVRYFEVS